MRRQAVRPQPGHLSDPDLAEWARQGDAKAFAELHGRHAALAARFATVVAGAGQDVPELATEGLLGGLAAGANRYPEPDIPFKLQMLAATRSATLELNGRHVTPGLAGWSPAVPGDVMARLVALPEAERSALWLGDVAHLDVGETACVLGVGESQAAALTKQARQRLADRGEAAGAALAALSAPLPVNHVAMATAAWRSWLRGKHHGAGAPAEPRPVGAGSLVASRLPRINLLRGAAVILLVAVMAGALLLNRNVGNGSNGSDGPALLDGSGGRAQAALRTDSRQPTGAKGNSGSKGSTTPGSSTTSTVRAPGTVAAAPAVPGGALLPVSLLDSAVVGTLAGPATIPVAPSPSSTTSPLTDPPVRSIPLPPPPPPGTRPPTTPPPVTLPPTTEPPTTEPPTTEPPTTLPPVTEPPTTLPPTTEPPTTEPPTTLPPVTEPPTTLPPVTEPPTTLPPVTEPPTTDPPVTDPAITLPAVDPLTTGVTA